MLLARQEAVLFLIVGPDDGFFPSYFSAGRLRRLLTIHTEKRYVLLQIGRAMLPLGVERPVERLQKSSLWVLNMCPGRFMQDEV